MNTTLKGLAKQAGFASVGFAFTTHSLRIGGASSMVHKGKARDAVKRIGWSPNSTCDELYQLSTSEDRGALSVAESQFRVLSVEDVHRMLPPAFWGV